MDTSKDTENVLLSTLPKETGQKRSLQLLGDSTNTFSTKQPRTMYKRPNPTLISRLSQVEGELQYKQHKLAKSIEQKNDQISDLRMQIMTLKTQKSNQELENCKIEDEYKKLQHTAENKEEEIDELKRHEADSLLTLDAKYDIDSKKLKVAFEEKVALLQEDITSQIDAILKDGVADLRKQRSWLSEECDGLSILSKGQSSDLNRKLIKMKEDYHKRRSDILSSTEDQVMALKNDLDTLRSSTLEKSLQRDAISSEITRALETENAALETRHSQLKLQFSAKSTELTSLRSTIAFKNAELARIKTSFSDKTELILYYTTKAAEITKQLSSSEHERRLLHNKLQELKGNIRVYCRVKPVTKAEQSECAYLEYPDNEFNESANQELLIAKDENCSSLLSSYQMTNSAKNSYTFQFDKIFSPTSSNTDIFEELSQLIQSSLDGYNVCVFAYGQTGSGKTWTMSHPTDGMVPLSIRKIFDDVDDLKAKGWEYTIEGLFVEIYNENIVDLLSNANKKLEIKHDDANRTTTITNVQTVNITSKEYAQAVLDKASRNRSTASTMANERSSRSHSIFILKLHGVNSETGNVSKGTLNLIDLAGSERLVNSQAKGERLKETQAINKSLSSLGDVIYSLGLQQRGQLLQHIPYRNSKLAYLLKHSLGGNSKTLMFVNISPLLKNMGETVSSLRFASKVNSTKLGV